MNINSRPLPLSMPPQLGAGGGMPKPRKLRLASVRMTPGTVKEKLTIAGDRILGRICRIIILWVEQPIAAAACTYTFSLMAIVVLLANLEPVMPPNTPIATISGIIPGPTREITTIRRIKPGMHIMASTNLCTIRSNLPPIYPLIIPIVLPMSAPIVVAERPTITEIRAP
ncbi:unnamed protein product [marine sediment metagenome]|uniref:Uncharacterized protein n=1 Tax=marine sediment metagenome TaxID=412755 RepID=X1R574_9ZZZZ